MVQSALLFLLGFLVAALLALLLAAPLWRRAQMLMRKRLEAVVPMTLEEVRADRDALRAEQAMAMRRLEVENEEIRRLDATHLIEIGRGREALKSRAATIEARDKQIEDMRDVIARLSQQVRLRERDLAALEVSHRLASREVLNKRKTAEAVASSLKVVESEAEARGSALAAKAAEASELGAKLEALAEELAAARETNARLSAERDELRARSAVDRTLAVENAGGSGALPLQAANNEALLEEQERAAAAELEIAALQVRIDELEMALSIADTRTREQLAEIAGRMARVAVLAEGPDSEIASMLNGVEGVPDGELRERIEAFVAAESGQMARGAETDSSALRPVDADPDASTEAASANDPVASLSPEGDLPGSPDLDERSTARRAS